MHRYPPEELAAIYRVIAERRDSRDIFTARVVDDSTQIIACDFLEQWIWSGHATAVLENLPYSDSIRFSGAFPLYP